MTANSFGAGDRLTVDDRRYRMSRYRFGRRLLPEGVGNLGDGGRPGGGEHDVGDRSHRDGCAHRDAVEFAGNPSDDPRSAQHPRRVRHLSCPPGHAPLRIAWPTRPRCAAGLGKEAAMTTAPTAGSLHITATVPAAASGQLTRIALRNSSLRRRWA